MAISIKVVDFAPRFRGEGYVMSYVTQRVLYSRIIRLETGDGRAGYGEIVSDPGLDLVEIQTIENAMLKSMGTSSLENLASQIPLLRSHDTRLSGLAFALETACMDLLSRHNGVPLYALLGGRQCADVVDYLSVSCANPGAMGERIRIEGREREVIQIKLDGKSMDTDMARIDATLAELRTSQTLLVDFNGALRPEVARSIIAGYSDKRIVWEEPCLSYEENRALAEDTGARLLFDQCLKTLADYARACSEGPMAGVCIKPMTLGGLGIARAARDMCAESGIAVRIDGLWCGEIATASVLHLAVGMPPKLLIAGCDLREPLILEEDWGGIVHKPGGRLAPSDNPGHGVTPPDKLWH